MTANLDSCLARDSDYILDVSIDKEACPNNLAPTSSTTAQLVLGDALAVCLLKLNDFRMMILLDFILVVHWEKDYF